MVIIDRLPINKSGKTANRVEGESETPKTSLIDWTAETTPDPQRVPTGATGFLGRNLLKQLIDDPRMGKIHCLAVRSEENLKSLREVDKELFEEADIVIHNRADVSRLKTYPALRLHLHLLPPTAATATRPRSRQASGSWSVPRIPTTFLSGSTGLPAPRFLGEDATETEFLQNLFKYSRAMKATMASDLLQASLDFVAAENVAKDIIANAIAGDQEQRLLDASPITTTAAAAVVTYVHQTGDFCLPISDMKVFLETETEASEPFELLPIGDWVDRATALGLHVSVGAAFQKVEDTGTRMVFPSFVKGSKDQRS
ncbi:MAG: hypothetical protein Q9201_000608 [Fulgogasparrea decipioides]